MLEGNVDAAHWAVSAPLRRFQPVNDGLGKRSTHKSIGSSARTVALAVNNSLLRPGSNARLSQAIRRFNKSFLAAFGLCCAIVGPVYAGSISGQAIVIDVDTNEIRGRSISLVAVDAPESRLTCIDARNRASGCGQQAAFALSNRIAGGPVACLSEGRDQ